MQPLSISPPAADDPQAVLCLHLQAAEIATSADDMSSLRFYKADLTQQLAALQQQHLELQEQHAGAVQQLARAQQDAQDIQQ